jgi:hypothetical protein
MNDSDQYKDTPENREQMRIAAETMALAQGIVYIVVRSKSTGQLAMEPKSFFNAEKYEILYEYSGGGRKAAEKRWEEHWRKLRQQGDLP